MPYNWQLPDWPEFRYDLAPVEGDLLAFADRAGQVSGILRGLPEKARSEAIVDLMIAEAIKTSEIEGEYLSREDVRSSILNQFGFATEPRAARDRSAEGVAELMVDVRKTWAAALNRSKLFAWHKMLMKGAKGFAAGRWRTSDEAMQVVSQSVGRARVHFEAPPTDQVAGEMTSFVRWFNMSVHQIKHGPVRSAIAHLYFESIHPFEDGNGRIGRALSEKALSQGLGRPVLLSLSQTIEADKKAYYDVLEQTQRSNEITNWVRYFVRVVLDAQISAERQVDFVLKKTRFFDRYRDRLNERQLRVIKRMLEEGPDGFEGGMNARKYRSLTRVSKATATRDLQALVELGAFEPIGEGRSRRYGLKSM